MEEKLAIVDLGSNTVRIKLIKVFKKGYFKLIDEAKETVRLSENMGQTHILTDKAMDRTIYSLKLFRELIINHRVDKIIAVATEAVRKAANRDEFLDRIYSETGFDFKLISGEEEAYYAYMGVIHTLIYSDFIIIDTGGGSTEIGYVENRRLKYMHSFPLGSVTLTERYLKDKTRKNPLKEMEKEIAQNFKTLKWMKEARKKKVPIVGLGGSIRTLAKINKQEIGFPLDNLHNYHLSLKEIIDIYNKIVSLSSEEIGKLYDAAKDRADILVGGITPLKVLLGVVNSDQLIISANGLREGLFFNNYPGIFLGEKWPIGQVLDYSINSIINNYGINIKHSKHVSKLALSLFDQLKLVHKIDNSEREILRVASLIHDVGMHINVYNHHKHSSYLILNLAINGLRNRELVMCSLMALLHRNQSPRVNWQQYNMLMSKEDMKTVRICALFLRIAEMLDRGEAQKVIGIKCHVQKGTIVMVLNSKNSPCQLEIDEAIKSRDRFKKLLGYQLEIRME